MMASILDDELSVVIRLVQRGILKLVETENVEKEAEDG